jgi:hypothetical protein
MAVEACVRLGDRVLVSLRYRPRIAPLKFFGIIACAVRLRNSVGTTAVKSPDQMLDVAQIRCDQTSVMKVDDLGGALAFSEAEISMVFRMRTKSRIVGILSCGVLKVDGAVQLECRG